MRVFASKTQTQTTQHAAIDTARKRLEAMR
jgi:hypothetical protein